MISLANWLRNAFAHEPAPPIAHEAFTPQLPREEDRDDHALRKYEEHEEGELTGQTFIIEYTDTYGDESRRRVTIRSLKRSTTGAVCLCAYCWERNAARSFRVDRIKTLARADTGEVIADPVAFFDRYLSANFAPESVNVMKRARPGLRALLYLARADGRVHPAELDIMRQYLELLAGDIKMDVSTIPQFIAKQHPDKGLAKSTLKAMWSHPDRSGPLLSCAALLAEADGVVVSQEEIAIETIRKLTEEPVPEWLQ